MVNPFTITMGNRVSSLVQPIAIKQPASLSSIIINDGIHDIHKDKNPYGLARRLMETILSYRHKNIYDEVAAGFIPNHGRYSPKKLLKVVSQKGHLDSIKYFLDKHPDLSHICTYNAALYNHLHIVKYMANESSVKRSEFVFTYGMEGAIINGHMNIIKFLIATYKGNLKYRPYYSTLNRTLDIAMNNQYIDIAYYLIEHQAYVSSSTVDRAFNNGWIDFIYRIEPHVKWSYDRYSCQQKALSKNHIELANIFSQPSKLSSLDDDNELIIGLTNE